MSKRYFRGNFGSHFYDDEGNPQYNAKPALARERGYFPSPTTVKKVMANEVIANWRINEMLKFVIYEMSGEVSDLDKRVRAAVKAFDAQQNKTFATGNAIHAAIERAVKKQQYILPNLDGVDPVLINPVNAWLRDREPKGEAEVTLVNKHDGYAGRTDFIGGFKGAPMHLMADFKSQGVKGVYARGPEKDAEKWQFWGPEKIKAKAYEDWIWQLAAYQVAATRMGIADMPQLVSVAVSTNPEFPGVAEYWWDAEEMQWGYEMFHLMLRLWYTKNRFRRPA